MGWAIQCVVARVIDIAVEETAAIEVKPVFGAVTRHSKDHPVFANRRGELTDDVAPGSHGNGIPRIERRVVHSKAVVMLCDRHHKARARGSKELCPGSRVELLGTEQRDEIFVAEGRLRSVCCHVMLVLATPLHVHIARVPLSAEGGYGIGPPVNEDPELAVLIPLWHADALQRFPRWAIRRYGLLHVRPRWCWGWLALLLQQEHSSLL